MVDVVPAIQSAIEIVNKLRTLSKKIENAEFNMLLAELTSDLANAKLEAANLKNDLAKQVELNTQLNSRLIQKDGGKPSLVDDAYKFVGDDGYFCTACFDTRQIRVRLSRLQPPFNDAAKWQCPSCKALLG
jgi:hypothetical protein